MISIAKPLFSITTPCFNSVHTIERTIRSVLTQKFKDYEYIIVDGGSTDGTLDIIKRYEPLFEGRMHWKSEPDKGLYDAFNKGIERSNGIYCWNVNSDDYITEDALLILSNFITKLTKDNLPIIFGNMNFISHQSGKLIKLMKANPKGLQSSYNNDNIGVPHPATLIPKVVYERQGYYDTKFQIIGDNDWFHRVYEAGEIFVYINAVLINMSDGGVSNNFNYRKSFRDRIYYLRKHYQNPMIRIVRWAKWTKNFFILKYRLFNKNV